MTTNQRDRLFITPSMVEALDLDGVMLLRASLVAEMSNIDAQLAARGLQKESDDYQTRLSFKHWRSRAVAARLKLHESLVIANDRIRRLKADSQRPSAVRLSRREVLDAAFQSAYERMELDPHDPLSLLGALYAVTDGVIAETGWACSEDEKAVLHAAASLLAGRAR